MGKAKNHMHKSAYITMEQSELSYPKDHFLHGYEMHTAIIQHGYRIQEHFHFILLWTT